MDFCLAQPQHLDRRIIMNKDLLLASMVASFKEANVGLAIQNGMIEKEARESIELMSSSIEKCMEKVLDNLIENFSGIIK